MSPEPFGVLPKSSGSGARAPRKHRVKRVPRRRTKISRGSGPLVRIETVTKRFHGEEKGKETIHKSKGKLPTKRRESLIKAMRASLKSPNTPPQLKAGLRKKLMEWTK